MLQDLQEISDGKYMAAMIWFGRRAETARDAMPAVRKWGHPLCLIPVIYGV